MTINAAIGDGAVAAGGSILLAPDASVGGNAMLAGGRVELAGRVLGDVRLGGGQVIISGHIDGNVELASQSLIIKPGAVIRGSLKYRSPEAAQIDPQAQIAGTVSHIKTSIPGEGEIAAGLTVVSILLWFSLALTGIVLYLVFPQTALSSIRIIATKPWKALGLGLALFAAMPVAGFILMSTGIGWLLALLLLMVYAILLLVGFLTGVLLLSDSVLRRIRHGQQASKFVNSLAFALAMLVVMIVLLIPVLGGLLFFLLWLWGIGGTALQIYNVNASRATQNQTV